MPTDTQSESSRRNGAKSRGPVTPAGKLASSRNSLRHGAFANAIVLEGESRDRFLELVHALCSELLPVTHIEKLLVYKMAAAQWRQTRLWTFERTAIHAESRKQREQTAASPADQDQPTLDSFAFRALTKANLSNQEMRFDRQFSRAYHSLLEGRKVEKAKSMRNEPGKSLEIEENAENNDQN